MLLNQSLRQRETSELPDTNILEQSTMRIASEEELVTFLDNPENRVALIVPKEPEHGKAYTISIEVLKGILPILAYYYGGAYSGIIARELFSYAYDYQYGIPELPCHWLNLICKARNFSAYNEYYNIYLPLREMAGDYGRMYGPTIAAGLAASMIWIAPPVARSSLGVVSKVTQSVKKMANALWSWGSDLCEQFSGMLLEDEENIEGPKEQEVPQKGDNVVIDIHGIDVIVHTNYWDSIDNKSIDALALAGFQEERDIQRRELSYERNSRLV